jgi:hypothetical protein
MFTSLLGLGDLAAKVTKTFKSIRGKVEGAVDGFIEKAGVWFKDKKGRRKERKDKKNKEKEDKKKGEGNSDKDSKKDKDKKGEEEEDEDIEGLTRPKSLKEPKPVKTSILSDELKEEIANTPDGTVLYKESGTPEQITKKLLKEHKDAKLNEKTGLLTLPVMQKQPFNKVTSLELAAKEVAEQTGVSKVILSKSTDQIQLDGNINPTVYGLATYTGVGASLQPLITEIEGHINTQHPQKEFLISICREAATRHGAKVFVKEIPYPKETQILFKHTSTNEEFKTQIVQDYQNNACPACAVNGPSGELTGPTGVSKPHSVISSSIFNTQIRASLINMGVTVIDAWADKVISTGHQPTRAAVTEDKQCTPCENTQGPYSLIQRKGGAAPIGNQYQNATAAQVQQLTKDKIERVLETIFDQLLLAPGTKNRPITSQIHTEIVQPDKVMDFIDDLRNNLLNAAQ